MRLGINAAVSGQKCFSKVHLRLAYIKSMLPCTNVSLAGKKKETSMKDKKISFKLETLRFEQLQAVADKEGVTVSSILRQLTSKYLDYCKINGFLEQR